MREGLLLINLGTPNSADKAAVRSYLREFLTDKRVIDLPKPIRTLLVYLFILPFRTKKSAHAYHLIWTKQGSPLLWHSQNLVKELQLSLKEDYQVALGMRYGQPSISSALNDLKDCNKITILPLYPQYSSAATGSSLEKVMMLLSKQESIPSVSIIRDFHQHPSYIHAQAQTIKSNLPEGFHLLLSYHGIPERHIHKTGCANICTDGCLLNSNKNCYMAQCYQTSRLLAENLKLTQDQYNTSFQSRLGKTPWIKPYTDEVLKQLATKGIKKLAIACPSFVADCLETLEEIGMRAKEQWMSLGGDEFVLIPSLNTDSLWIKALIEISSRNINK